MNAASRCRSPAPACDSSTWTSRGARSWTSRSRRQPRAVRGPRGPGITPWGGGKLVTSEGQEGEKETLASPPDGVRSSGSGPRPGRAGRRHRPDRSSRESWPTCWFTRDYGFMSPMPFNWIEKPWRLAAGQAVPIRHRVVRSPATRRKRASKALQGVGGRVARTRIVASTAGAGQPPRERLEAPCGRRSAMSRRENYCGGPAVPNRLTGSPAISGPA